MLIDELEIQVAAAQAYEALFVPALFAPWAPHVADAANLAPGLRVLDVACGTGVLAREAFARTGPSGYVAGLDPAPGMLAVAQELAPSVDWRQGSAESIPFPDATFDAVVCQFGLMFMEPGEAIREMLRVLRPGGCMVVAVWDEVGSIPAYAAEAALVERLAGPRAAEALRAPFALGDRRRLESLLLAAGTGSPRIDTVRDAATFPGVRVMVEADLRGWLPLMGVELAEERISRILDEAEEALRGFVTDDGRITFATSAHIAATGKS